MLLTAVVLTGCNQAAAPTTTASVPAPHAAPLTALEGQLLAEDPVELANAARQQGDPFRGALLFHRPSLACAKCHVPDVQVAAVGPSLLHLPPPVFDAHLVESMLAPSKTIRQGFELTTLTLADGRTASGVIVADEPDGIVLRDASGDGAPQRYATADIETRQTAAVSPMPTGLVNQLASRSEFLDLAAYVIEIVQNGRQRYYELTPDATLRQAPQPEYERRLDHAGLIAELGPENLTRGAELYRRICFNCHGDQTRDGSLLFNRRFTTHTFRAGSDPYRMYQTVTHGLGQMPPHGFLTPQQRYDAIHYVRETFLKPHNSAQYTAVDDAYLAALPPGDQRGPTAARTDPWATMNYGPTLTATYHLPRDPAGASARTAGDTKRRGDYLAKGIAIRLDDGPGGVAQGKHWLAFDHDRLDAAAAWSGTAMTDWQGINFNGVFGDGPKITGDVLYSNLAGPAWADPVTGSWTDPRPTDAGSGAAYGPLPRQWGRFRGLYHWGDRTVLSYQVGEAEILEWPWLEAASAENRTRDWVLGRTLEIGPAEHPLRLRVVPVGVQAALHPASQGASLETQGGHHVLTLPASGARRVIKLLVSRRPEGALQTLAGQLPGPQPLTPWTQGGPRRWPDELPARAQLSKTDGPFAVDVLPLPVENPWSCQVRPTGVDFFADGDQLALCTIDGDVWRAAGLSSLEAGLRWQRIASGLYQPLGLRIVNDQVYVCCRDQLVVLRDLNGDGETDFYENFNSDHQLTEHFHSFASGLQTDAAGNFYYARGARLDRPAVPHDGVVARVAADGSRTEILATGLRSPNGLWLDEDGTVVVTDQDGPWVPANSLVRIEPGGFHGYQRSFGAPTNPEGASVVPPMCWIPLALDRSPAEPVRVPAGAWGPLGGALLSLSYGHGRMLIAPYDARGERWRGAVSALPLAPFPTGLARGRFHPTDGHFYLCGLFVWASSQTQPGGLYRVRYTGAPLHVPVDVALDDDAVQFTLSGAVDGASCQDLNNFHATAWSLRRSEAYGSEAFGRRMCPVRAAALAEDGRTVKLTIDDLRPATIAWIQYTLRTAAGEKLTGEFFATLGPAEQP